MALSAADTACPLSHVEGQRLISLGECFAELGAAVIGGMPQWNRLAFSAVADEHRT